MGATFSRIKNWVAEILTYADLNAEFNNILTNLTPAGVDDASTNAPAMQATADPYPGASESLATSLEGELQRIRYVLAQITGETYWYVDPDTTLAAIATAHTEVVLTKQLVGFTVTGGTTSKTLTVSDTMTLTGYASTAEINTGTEAAKAIAPDQLMAAGVLKNANRMLNVGLAASVGSKALTLALKGEDGNDPSATNPVVIAFRDETLTTGTPNVRTQTAAQSLVIPSGATFGFAANETGRIYIWEIDNAGTCEMAASRTTDIFPESNLVSTTAIGTGSDSATVMYSTTARTNVACRCIGYIEITTGAVPGEWDNAPSKVQIIWPGGVSSKITRGGTIVNTIDYVPVMNVIVWYANVACTVTNVRGYRVGGNNTVAINARRNGSGTKHLATDKTLANADTWYDGGAVQDTAYAVGDKLEIMVTVAAGSPTQIAIQVDFTVP